MTELSRRWNFALNDISTRLAKSFGASRAECALFLSSRFRNASTKSRDSERFRSQFYRAAERAEQQLIEHKQVIAFLLVLS